MLIDKSKTRIATRIKKNQQYKVSFTVKVGFSINLILIDSYYQDYEL